MATPISHTHLASLVLDVPERGFQAPLGQEAVLQALQEEEERWLVGKEERRMGNTIIANQNELS